MKSRDSHYERGTKREQVSGRIGSGGLGKGVRLKWHELLISMNDEERTPSIHVI